MGGWVGGWGGPRTVVVMKGVIEAGPNVGKGSVKVHLVVLDAVDFRGGFGVVVRLLWKWVGGWVGGGGRGGSNEVLDFHGSMGG